MIATYSLLPKLIHILNTTENSSFLIPRICFISMSIRNFIKKLKFPVPIFDHLGTTWRKSERYEILENCADTWFWCCCPPIKSQTEYFASVNLIVVFQKKFFVNFCFHHTEFLIGYAIRWSFYNLNTLAQNMLNILFTIYIKIYEFAELWLISKIATDAT